jgi:hypothetical protein
MFVEERRVIEPFSKYEISNFGRVFNLNTGREMTLSPTQQGELTVGLTIDGVQHRRSVKVLVARAFVDGETEVFDTPIQLDGDRTNLMATNIMWRPRWFALAYIKQFDNPLDWYYSGPVVNATKDLLYDYIFLAATSEGVLCEAIRDSIFNGTKVFPTGCVYIN